MANTFKLNKLIVSFVTLSFALSPVMDSYALDIDKQFEHNWLAYEEYEKKDGTPLIIDFDEKKEVTQGKKFPKVLLPPGEIEEEYTETSFKRFDIVFFLSIPFIFAYQLLLHQLITSNASINGQSDGQLSGQQWLSIGISTIIISSGIAYEDYVVVSEMKQRDDMMPTSSSRLPIDDPYRLNLSWQFGF